jgi:hypothetical protein
MGEEGHLLAVMAGLMDKMPKRTEILITLIFAMALPGSGGVETDAPGLN